MGELFRPADLELARDREDAISTARGRIPRARSKSLTLGYYGAGTGVKMLPPWQMLQGEPFVPTPKNGVTVLSLGVGPQRSAGPSQ